MRVKSLCLALSTLAVGRASRCVSMELARLTDFATEGRIGKHCHCEHRHCDSSERRSSIAARNCNTASLISDNAVRTASARDVRCCSEAVRAGANDNAIVVTPFACCRCCCCWCCACCWCREREVVDAIDASDVLTDGENGCRSDCACACAGRGRACCSGAGMRAVADRSVSYEMPAAFSTADLVSCFRHHDRNSAHRVVN